MPENFEDSNRYESTGKQIDALEKSINSLDNNNGERIDFTGHMQELQDINNTFIRLDADINSIMDENEKKNLQERLDKLKVMMMDLISDGSIDNFIDGKTKDEFINSEVNNLNNLFSDRIKKLINSLEPGIEPAKDILYKPWTNEAFIGTLTFLGIPCQEISIAGEYYPGFLTSTGAIALIEGELKECEPDFGSEDLGQSSGSKKKNKTTRNGVNISYSDKWTGGGIDNPTGKQQTIKVSHDFGNGFNTFVLFDSKDFSTTPSIGVSKKLFDAKLGNNIKTNTQITASYSPGSIGKSMDKEEAEKYEGGFKDKDVYKGKIVQNFRLKDGFSISIGEIFKTSDFSNIGITDFISELKASYKPRSNINLSVAATISSEKNKDTGVVNFKPSVGFGATIKF